MAQFTQAVHSLHRIECEGAFSYLVPSSFLLLLAMHLLLLAWHLFLVAMHLLLRLHGFHTFPDQSRLARGVLHPVLWGQMQRAAQLGRYPVPAVLGNVHAARTCAAILGGSRRIWSVPSTGKATPQDHLFDRY